MAWRTSAPICCNIARTAMQVLKPELAWKYGAMSLGEYVRQQGYSQAFNRDYLLPMCAAVWSVPNAQVSPSCLLASFPFCRSQSRTTQRGSQLRETIFDHQRETHA